MFDHVDVLNKLNNSLPLADRLISIHDVVKQHFPAISRIAVALYDPATDVLKTYAHSSGEDNPLTLYETKLSTASSLREIVEQGRPRVVQDLSVFGNSTQQHAQKISAQGYRASYTMPIYQNSEFFGFLFYNSYESNCFSEENLGLLDIFGHLIALTIINELTSIRTLLASVQAARHVTHHRDVETGAHVNRTAHYARLIAKELAEEHELDDDFIEHVFLFSPLHDIGKISVPDEILHKPARLDEREFEVMKTHAQKGREIIDELLKDFGLSTIEHVDVLRNIAQYHHEAVDGSGYPEGLRGKEIPLESRISAVADVFDALTSKRPYKEAWSNEEAISAIRRLAGSKLDKQCVEALVMNLETVLEIQHRFKDESV